MCSIVMPGDFDMLVAHSPPIFCHSPPPTPGFLSYPRPARQRKPASKSSPKGDTPTRPILIIRAANGNDVLDEGPCSPTRLKKRVVFADDRGMSLCHVRVMREPSHLPPTWSSRFLAQACPGLLAEPLVVEAPWEIAFAQPASDYVTFRKRLDADKVSLENVVVKAAEAAVVGTVKVCNLAFEKHVYLRITTDGWRSHTDLPCAYLAGNVSSAAYVLHDTFAFKAPLPAASRRLEFCVLFSCNSCDYWDNNRGENYVLLKRSAHSRCEPKSPDVLSAKGDAWSEFASWNQSDNSSPYW